MRRLVIISAAFGKLRGGAEEERGEILIGDLPEDRHTSSDRSVGSVEAAGADLGNGQVAENAGLKHWAALPLGDGKAAFELLLGGRKTTHLLKRHTAIAICGDQEGCICAIGIRGLSIITERVGIVAGDEIDRTNARQCDRLAALLTGRRKDLVSPQRIGERAFKISAAPRRDGSHDQKVGELDRIRCNPRDRAAQCFVGRACSFGEPIEVEQRGNPQPIGRGERNRLIAAKRDGTAQPSGHLTFAERLLGLLHKDRTPVREVRLHIRGNSGFGHTDPCPRKSKKDPNRSKNGSHLCLYPAP
ncbi:hypothetical protein Q4F19_06300 [Sphingomonas sp. BIUV-7]|uniref:Uncharacterized protein n=1 Tax=Sphingomonas natans TaxID=3063330 RepID=A0ABT8Y6P0_9SPHN|nr:hypothetical protein [Sphingomonas sp. BIUV-7]MDO6413987.1 hypothetical protein [Sphingomonas sp. BIUV-7]